MVAWEKEKAKIKGPTRNHINNYSVKVEFI